MPTASQPPAPRALSSDEGGERKRLLPSSQPAPTIADSGRAFRHASKRGTAYSFLFVHPDGSQLAEIGELLKAGRIRPVIDKVFPFEQAKEALAYLEKGRAKGKVVVQMR
jgi:NADPH:quinone reductase-like Zn-dependent oxidoreductase